MKFEEIWPMGFKGVKGRADGRTDGRTTGAG